MWVRVKYDNDVRDMMYVPDDIVLIVVISLLFYSVNRFLFIVCVVVLDVLVLVFL